MKFIFLVDIVGGVLFVLVLEDVDRVNREAMVLHGVFLDLFEDSVNEALFSLFFASEALVQLS